MEIEIGTILISRKKLNLVGGYAHLLVKPFSVYTGTQGETFECLVRRSGSKRWAKHTRKYYWHELEKEYKIATMADLVLYG